MEKNYQRRIEKISQAIYLVSNHLKDNEPLKYELRKESIGFLSCIRSMAEDGESTDLPPDLIVDALGTYARDLVSLLNLGSVAGLISRTNAAIITQEIESLLGSFKEVMQMNSTRPGFVLSQEFFSTDGELPEMFAQRLGKGQPNFIKDNTNGLFNEKIPFPKNVKNEKGGTITVGQNTAQKVDNLKDKKDDRQARILTLLRARSNLSIKDFASVIPDCSEKTIQRELLELVEKGVVKKEGERRWSTYSLK